MFSVGPLNASDVQAALRVGAERRASQAAVLTTRLAATIGTAWEHVGDDTRREFIEEWVGELRIRQDGGLDILPREPYREIVYAAQQAGTVGCAGPHPAEPIYSFRRRR